MKSDAPPLLRRAGRRYLPEDAMGHAAKIFLATSFLILALVGIAAWSLRAVSDLVAVNQAIIMRSVPALRLEMSLRQSVASLLRLDARAAVLRDATYVALWDARA